MPQVDRHTASGEDWSTFNRRFRQAIYAYAILEFIAIAVLVYFWSSR